MSTAYLVVLGERDAIRWVLEQQRMAFPATPRSEVAALSPGDQLLLYATRGAWHNPGRDRGRIIGSATPLSAVRVLETPIEIAGRSFHSTCDLRIEGVVPYPGGLELRPFVDKLMAFPKRHAWSIYLRRALLQLPEDDLVLLKRELQPLLVPRDRAFTTYPSKPAGATR